VEAEVGEQAQPTIFLLSSMLSFCDIAATGQALQCIAVSRFRWSQVLKRMLTQGKAKGSWIYTRGCHDTPLPK
jgi:hypothetical protein